jgi:hypothetical protein
MLSLVILLVLVGSHRTHADAQVTFELAEPSDDFYGNAFDELGRVYLATYPCGGSCHTSGRLRLPRFENGIYRVSVVSLGMALGWSTDSKGYGGNEPYQVYNEYYFDSISLKWYLARGEHYLQLAYTSPGWTNGNTKVHITAPVIISKATASVYNRLQANINATRVF